MNRIDLLKYQQFPMSSETLAFMQDMVTLTAKLASIGGNSYILEGCEEVGDYISSGTVIINGEILPFVSGQKIAEVVIQEEKEGVQVYDDTYTNLYIKRKVIFGSGGTPQLLWSSFQRLPSLLTMAQTITNLDTALTSHITNHTVAWDRVTGKPNAFTPVTHSHPWSAISEKPSAYPPESHIHTGMAVYLGEFDAAGTTVDKVAGSLPAVYVARVQEGIYKLTHNIGHTNYIVVGVGAGVTQCSVRAMFDVLARECKVTVADDGTRNDMRIRFSIIAF